MDYVAHVSKMKENVLRNHWIYNAGLGVEKILIIPIFALFITMLSFSHQDAQAASYELQIGDTNGACEAIGGTWGSSVYFGGSNTCSLTSGLNLSAGDSLTIDSGVILVKY